MNIAINKTDKCNKSYHIEVENDNGDPKAGKMKILKYFIFLLLVKVMNFFNSSDRPGIFPYKEFFNTKLMTSHDIMQYLCEPEEIKLIYQSKQCSCHPTCLNFGTCCINWYWNSGNFQSSFPIESYISLYLEVYKTNNTKTCQQLFPTSTNQDHPVKNYLMVDHCNFVQSDEENNTMAEKDQNSQNCQIKDTNEWRYIAPVVDYNNVMYRNEFCAKCNSVMNYTHVKISTKCWDVTIPLQEESVINISELNDKKKFQHCLWDLPDQKPNLCNSVGLHSGNATICDLYGARLWCGITKTPRCGKCDIFLQMDKGIDALKYPFQFQLHWDNKINQMRLSKHHLYAKFPILKFFEMDRNMTISTVFDMCESKIGCISCQCDDLCYLSRRCCIDKYWNQTNPKPLKEYLEKFVKKAFSSLVFTCEPLIPNNWNISNTTVTGMYYMIKMCQPNSSMKDQHFCVNRTTLQHLTKDVMVPVFGDNGRLYSNSYCAKCNFIFKYTYVEILEAEETLRGHKMHDIFIIKNYKSYNTKPCWKLKNRNCSEHDLDYKLCESYKGFSFDVNPHCSRCMMETKKKIVVDTWAYCGNKKIPYYSRAKTLSFSASEGVTYCTDNTIFDNNVGECVQKLCLPYYVRIGSKCQKVSDKCTEKNCKLTYLYLLLNTIASNVTDAANLNLNLTVFQSIFTSFKIVVDFDILRIAKKSDIIILTSQQSVGNENYFKILREFNKTSSNMVSQLWLNGVEEIIFSHKVLPQSITNLYGFSFAHIFPDGRFCNKPVQLFTNNITTERSSLQYRNLTSDVSVVITVKKNKTIEQEYICKQFHLDKPCIVTLLKDNDISFDHSGNLQHGAEIYKPDEYAPTSEGYHVCLTPRNQKVEKLELIEFYMTIVVSTLSNIGYLWIIFEFSIFREVRSIPGCNTMFLCCFLLFSDVVFSITFEVHKSKTGCHVISVIQHWSLLCVFMWTFVITFDLVRTFGGSISSTRNISLKKSTIHRFFIAVLPPTIVVVTSTILDETGAVDIGYDNNQCWMSNVTAKISLYIVPIMLISFMCTVGLVYTVYQINRQYKKSEKVLQRGTNSSKGSVKIAIKLILILGIVEIIGLVQINPENPTETEQIINAVAQFLFGFLRSFRGIGLWLCYIPGGKSWKFCKQRSWRRTVSRSSYLQKSTTSMSTIRSTTSNNTNL